MDLIRAWLFETYQFLASIKVPGFDISFIQLFFGVNGVLLSLYFARTFFNLGLGSISRSIRGGNNKNIKVSEKRRYDRR